MTDKPDEERSQYEAPTGPEASPREVSRVPVPVSRNAWRWTAPLALLVAVIAVGLAVWALVRPPSETSMGGQQPGDPKARVCTAFDTVTKAVRLQTHANLGPDPVAVEVVAAQARLALFGGGQYLLSRLGPDTPQELADEVRAFANNLEDIGMNALAGVPNSDPAQTDRFQKGEENSANIVSLCK